MSKHPKPAAFPWLPLFAGASAGGLGWGIRGQYGHETGAMLSGVLVGFALLCLLGRHLSSGTLFRAVALLAVGVGFGGAETYGQTIGLTQDTELVGNRAALTWGLLGLFLKGGVWIGIAGAFFGIGLGGRRLRIGEATALMATLMALWLFGEWLFHTPFDPANHRLPSLYFSATWDWFPDKPNLKPRLERWGALLLAWAGLLAWSRLVRRDPLAVRLGLVGFLAGGVGFAGGQCIQSAHAWHPEWFTGVFGKWDPLINWWNMMEITFGSVWGGAFGVALARWKIFVREPDEIAGNLPAAAVAGLVIAQCAALWIWTVLSWDAFDTIADRALPMGVIPLWLVASGGWGAAMVALPLVAAPIAAKTFAGLCLDNHTLPRGLGALLFGIVPASLLAIALPWKHSLPTARQAACALAVTGLVYYGLNFAFFEFPWPWNPPTGRTPSVILFSSQLLVLGWVAVRTWVGSGREPKDGHPTA